jgi:prolyl oligopeptidase
VAGDEDGFSFVLGAPDRSAGLYRYERDSGRIVELRPPEARFPFVATRYETTAPDGAMVAYEVVHRADLEPAGLPAVLYAYGGWNVALVRGALAANAHLVEAGAAFVLCHIRGGGEEGTDFHRDGALERKQHSYDDLYAIAEDVAARGIADPARIAVLGGSNGGLMVAVAVTQRPDLWCAACSLVPVTDMLRYHLSPYGETGLREYGDPDEAADAAVLRAYSPYHNIRAGIRYPPTLVVAGANDMRCPAWHARKFVARLQAEAEGGPFVLRVMGGGHLSTRRGADLVAEWQGFLLRALGLAGPG